ncbi:hypothetical protein MNR01_04775 [Lysobacter sp. S4-A87]|uniref:hypothetical protein n=1 Tax=Lysobacter sp. S4-A87 TaxID=2925843 RepID=UPI001F52F85D|nr:hypothetical protein [Lysobacter sp. S4-A87]UNK50348.1 hypothetical protein MNR01_04775 [Lysobacter sp. S4-A87]
MKRTAWVAATIVLTGVALAATVFARRTSPEPAAPLSAPASVAAMAPAGASATAPAVRDAARFHDGEAGLSPSERAGREIWYKATGGNSRFHSYVFQQRVGPRRSSTDSGCARRTCTTAQCRPCATC